MKDFQNLVNVKRGGAYWVSNDLLIFTKTKMLLVNKLET